MCLCPLRSAVVFLTFLNFTVLLSNVMLFNTTILCILSENGPASLCHYSEFLDFANNDETYNTNDSYVPQKTTLEVPLVVQNAGRLKNKTLLDDGTMIEAYSTSLFSNELEMGNITQSSVLVNITQNLTFKAGLNDTVLDLFEDYDMLSALNMLTDQENSVAQSQFKHTNACNSSQMTTSKPFVILNFQKSHAYASFAWGLLFGILPFAWCTHRYGARLSHFAAGIISAVATICTPFGFQQSFWYFIVCRVFQGFSLGSLLPTAAAVTANWAPLKENELVLGVLFWSLSIAPVVSSVVSAIVCTSNFRWSIAYYCHGAVTFLLFFVWFGFYRNSPMKHSCIGGVELNEILTGKGVLKKRTENAVPWKLIFHTIAIWAILISTVGAACGVGLLLYYSPMYLKTVYQFETFTSGLVIAMASLSQWITVFGSGFIFGCLPWPTRLKVRIFNSIGLFSMAGYLTILGFVPAEYPKAGVAVLICSMGALGFTVCGFLKSILLVAKEYAMIILGLVSVESCFVFILLPYPVSVVTPTNTINEWRVVYFSTSGTLILTGLVFLCFGEGAPAKWTKAYQQTHGMIEDDNVSMEAGILEIRTIEPKPKS